jgi:hypothetical protein
MVYIAADNPLPLIEWQENITPFSVTELTEDEYKVKKQFTKPFIAHLGSFEGCSCGFYIEDNESSEGEDDKRRDELAYESVKQLSAYLSNIVKNGSIEIFARWHGNEESEPEERIIVAPDYFGGNEFGFEDKQFIEVI